LNDLKKWLLDEIVKNITPVNSYSFKIVNESSRIFASCSAYDPLHIAVNADETAVFYQYKNI